MRLKSAIWLVVLLCLVILGCNSEEEPSSQSSGAGEKATLNIPAFDSVATDQVFVYNCGDSLEFTTHVTPDSAWLFLSDTTVKVLPVKAGSGARYEGGNYLYWSKGDEAILQKPYGSFMVCQTIPQERSWASARLRGIDFRALGQEPIWFLELTEGGTLKYVGNYGSDTLVVDTPKPTEHSQDQRMVYQAEKEDQHIEVFITDTPCTDIMSGFDFPQTVSVTVNGETYNGCGRYLQ